MPNNFGAAVTVDAGWIAKKSLSMLMNKLNFAMAMDKRYTRDFMDMDFPIGETMTVRKKFRPVGRIGMEMQPQNIETKRINIQMNQPFGVDLTWSDWEKILQMPRDSEFEEYIDPSIDFIANQIEVAAFNFAVANCPNVVGALGTNPTDSLIADAVRAKLLYNGGFREGSTNIWLTPAAMRTIRQGERTTFNPQMEQSNFFRRGYLGSAAGLEWNESVCMPSFTAGVTAVSAGAFTVSTDGNQSGSTLNILGTNGDIIKAGTIIGITGTKFVNPGTRQAPSAELFTFQTKYDVTISGGAGTLTLPDGFEILGPGNPYQNIDILPPASSPLVIFPGTTAPGGATPKAGALGIACAPEAYFMVSAKWPDNAPGVKISNAKSRKTGIELSIVEGFDIRTRQSLIRIDAAVGFGAALSENAACVVALGS